MQIRADLGGFNAAWAVVVHRVRGGFDRDAFSGINLGKNARATDAGSVVVTGGAEHGGAARLALHIAAAAPDGAAVPVRLPALSVQTPVDFLERVDRYVQAEPALRLRMALGDTPPAQPERLADIERELMLLAEHAETRRAGPPPDCAVAPTWSAARAEQAELLRRRDALAALEYTLAMVLRETGRSRRYDLATLLERAAAENVAGDIETATRKGLLALLSPPGKAEPVAEPPRRRAHETAPSDVMTVHEPELAGSHPNVRLRHPAAAWAKVVRAVDPANGRGGYAFTGPFLRRNAQNDVPVGSILITAHEVGSRRHPHSERMASLVCIDADGHPLRVPMGSDANRTDLDFRDYVAGYLEMPAMRRAARLLDSLYSGEPGPHAAISSRPDRERLLVTQYVQAIQNTIEALETAGATGELPDDEPGLEIAGAPHAAAG